MKPVVICTVNDQQAQNPSKDLAGKNWNRIEIQKAKELNRRAWQCLVNLSEFIGLEVIDQ